MGFELCAGRHQVPDWNPRQWDRWYRSLPSEVARCDRAVPLLRDKPVFINLDSWQALEPSILLNALVCGTSRPVVWEWTERARDQSELERAGQVFQRLQQHGPTAVDDVGEGFDGVGRCITVTPSYAKVSMNVLRKSREVGLPLLRSVVQALQSLGAQVIVEGVEDARDARLVSDSGAQFAQGYFYGRDILAHASTN